MISQVTKPLKQYARLVMIISAVIIILYSAVFAGILSLINSAPTRDFESFTYAAAQSEPMELFLTDYNKALFDKVDEKQFNTEKLYYHTIATSDVKVNGRKKLFQSFALILIFLIIFYIHLRMYRDQ